MRNSDITRGSQELLKLTKNLISRAKSYSRASKVSIADLAYYSGYSTSKVRKWNLSEEAFESVTRLVFLAQSLGIRPELAFNVLSGKISAEEAVAMSGTVEKTALDNLQKKRKKATVSAYVFQPSLNDPVKLRLRNKFARVIQFGHRGVDDYFKTSEIALLFGVRQRTVQWWSAKGKMGDEFTKGRHQRIRIEVIKKFADEEGIALMLDSFFNKNVLVVEEASNAQKIKKIFKSNDPMKLFVEDNIQNLGYRLRELNPAFVIVSASLKGLDVKRIVQHLSVAKSGNLLALIVIAPAGDSNDYIAMGANMVIRTPYQPKELKEALNNIEKRHLGSA